MRKRVMIVAGAVGTLWLGASLLSAQPPGSPDERDPASPKAGRMERLLGLSEQQKATFHKVLEQQRPEQEALHNELRESRQKLEEALATENPDPATVGELAIRRHRLMEKQRALRARADEALRGVLTPEQRAKLDVLQSLREGPGPFGPGGGPGGRPFGDGPFSGRWGAGGRRGPGAEAPVERR